MKKKLKKKIDLGIDIPVRALLEEKIARQTRAIAKFQDQIDVLRAENVELAEENSKKLRRLGDSFQAWLNSIDFL